MSMSWGVQALHCTQVKLGAMTSAYTVKLYDAEGVSEEQQRAAQKRFRQVLEDTLGDAALVLPVYQAYQRIAAAYGDAAIAAVYGPLRGMGDGFYELRPAEPEA
jgi:hypothetical protein